MCAPINFISAQREKALEEWLHECRAALTKKFPKIDFDSELWPIRTVYQTEQSDWNFTKPFADFADKDVNFQKVFRCLVAERFLDGRPKNLDTHFKAYRALKGANARSIFDLTVGDCKEIEANFVSEVQLGKKSANNNRGILVR